MAKAWKYFVFVGMAIALAAALLTRATPAPAQAREPQQTSFIIRGGTVEFDFNTGLIEALGHGMVARGQLFEDAKGPKATFRIDPSSTLGISCADDGWAAVSGGVLHTRGAFLLERPGDRIVIGNLAFRDRSGGVLTIGSTLDLNGAIQDVFDLQFLQIESPVKRSEVLLSGNLTICDSFAQRLDLPAAAGAVVGTVRIDGLTKPAYKSELAAIPSKAAADSTSPPLIEDEDLYPDVIVADLQTIRRYGTDAGITAFSVGTTACNLGTDIALWISYTNQHPVIIQNAYRLKDNRFEQIGVSWVKHGFYAVAQDLCGPCDVVSEGWYLAVGCSDPYSATLNGVQTNMSPRSTVNAHNGSFPYPWPGWTEDPPPSSVIDRRLQIHNADLEPVFNLGARYFVQGHYVTSGDALSGTHDNNASYREVLAEKDPDTGEYKLVIDPGFHTQREQPAVRAWKDCDPSVVETDIHVPGEGLFILAAKVFEVGTGVWRYSYALQNLNSDQSGRSFKVRTPPGALVANTGFHDVDYHSGEPYSPTDWAVSIESESVTWSTETYETNPNANALRFGTVYSFYLDSNIEPAPTTVTIGLFKPGAYPEVHASTIGPKLLMMDCNNNDIADECDVDCENPGCGPPCGASFDCNSNDIPDECEADCDHNGLVDECDMANCQPGELWCGDCNGNSILDACETDCNDNGLPDNCEILPDTDDDGVVDCYDLCPESPVDYACACPDFVRCCFPDLGFCYDNWPYQRCLDDEGVPDCYKIPCRQGCMIGDYDDDGDLTLADFQALQSCMSEDVDDPGYVAPPQECSIPLDYDDDNDVDLVDFSKFHEVFTLP